MTIWGTLIKDSKIIKSYTVTVEDTDTRTHRIFRAMDIMCEKLDISHPIWLETSISEFKKSSRTRFGADCFIEKCEFDYFSFQILDE